MRFSHKDRATPLKSVAPYQVDKMSYNNNNSSNVAIPVGFRFHPTDEELVGWYLHNRVTAPPPEPREDDQRIIRELDLYKHEPWDLAEVCKIPGDHSVNQNNWYFFSHKDKKYPTGNRANRATKAGFWKATGRDKCIQTRYSVGMRKTLVFYKGRAPHGQKTDWIMHEFRLDDGNQAFRGFDEAGAWVVCRVFRKTKNIKTKGDDTPSTSMEEDQHIALQPDITDSPEKFSSDGGEDGRDVDYPPTNMVPNHIANYDMHCKQELFPVNEFRNLHHNLPVHLDNHGIEAILPQSVAPHSLFRITAASTRSNYSAIHLPSSDFDQQMLQHMGTGSSAAGLFSPMPNNAYHAIIDDHPPRPHIRGMGYRNSSEILNGLAEFQSFGHPALQGDQTLTDVVSRPLERLQQLQQSTSDLLSTNSVHDVIHNFGMPSLSWQARPQSHFVEFCTNPDSINSHSSTFLSSGE
ncbi:uncharacterized protein [Physcomitrium patens]|uniref:NAC domain-containing protein n=1 Tax=Physcomitrium patens TaxID=3218 RepID=A0A7I4DXK9_PHYPA|nr:NAC domain-containing protein 37-like isoform X2 [Physcomitrium patens]|eukprot:XP_024377729.1 NAC domain-containing protein 37-like isoform X2 [Physcomitrella patens]